MQGQNIWFSRQAFLTGVVLLNGSVMFIDQTFLKVIEIRLTFYRNHYNIAYGFAHSKIYMECVYTFTFVNHCMYIQWPNIATYFALNHVDRVATIQPLKCRNTHTLKQL